MSTMLTILTATYNRAILLSDLYASLCRQTCKDFIWIIVDDGSVDETVSLLRQWEKCNRGFRMQWCTQTNSGKNCAVNNGIQMVETDYTMLLDSDDYLTDDAVEYVLAGLKSISDEKNMAGIAGLKMDLEQGVLTHMKFEQIDASNLERRKYGIEKDCCEIYRTELLRSHPFPVWPGEKFTPEEVVWNQLALEGWQLRWFNKTICIVRYLESGLTKSSWHLLKNNPMGYAMMYNHRLLYSPDFSTTCYYVIQMIAYAILANNIGYIFNSNRKFLALFMLPLGCFLSLRRKLQYQKNL